MITAHQPNYMPYLGFFEKIIRSDEFVVVDNTQFVKRGPFGWIHRNRIRTEKGWDWLTVPVLTKGKFTQLISDVRINNQLPWRRKHIRALEFNYRKASYAAEHMEFFRELYSREFEFLMDLTLEVIRYGMKVFGIDVPVKIASEIGVGGKSTGYVIDLCEKTGHTRYLSGTHGRDYLDLDMCREAGIEIVFQDYEHSVYPQLHPGEFVPNLSFVDCLFNTGPDAPRLMRGGRDAE
ncbi:MAG: hypothetical protein E3J72_11690 [Planctomycetota bacterium]|nr:MAG: hypothetical protein E3J72_11690 [Planctomycetota bacterium]